MPKQTELYLTKGIRQNAVMFSDADDTTIKDLMVAEADDAKVVAIAITNTEAIANTLLLYWWDPATPETDWLQGHIPIPASAGFDGTENTVNGLGASLTFLPQDGAGAVYLPLQGNSKLRAALKTAVGTAEAITVTVYWEYF